MSVPENKNREEMSDHELLRAILETKESEARSNRLLATVNIAILVVLLAALAFLVPKTLKTFRQIDAAVTQVNELSDQAKTSLEGIDRMVENMNTVIVENTDEVNEAMDKISKIDFDKLNQSIKTLSDTIAPLAGLFGRFQ